MRNIREVLKFPGPNPEVNSLYSVTAFVFSVGFVKLHKDRNYILAINCKTINCVTLFFHVYIVPGLIWFCKSFLMCMYSEELFDFVWGDIYGL